METLTWFLEWASYLSEEYGPILVSINAIWSLCRKIRGLFVGKKSTQGQAKFRGFSFNSFPSTNIMYINARFYNVQDFKVDVISKGSKVIGIFRGCSNNYLPPFI